MHALKNNIVENQAKIQLEKQFKELSDKALAMYPELGESLEIMDTLTEAQNSQQDYIELTATELYETSTNQFTII